MFSTEFTSDFVFFKLWLNFGKRLLQKIALHGKLTDSLEILRLFGFKVFLLLGLASGKDIWQSLKGIFFPFTNDVWMNIIHFGEPCQ